MLYHSLQVTVNCVSIPTPFGWRNAQRSKRAQLRNHPYSAGSWRPFAGPLGWRWHLEEVSEAIEVDLSVGRKISLFCKIGHGDSDEKRRINELSVA